MRTQYEKIVAKRDDMKINKEEEGSQTPKPELDKEYQLQYAKNVSTRFKLDQELKELDTAVDTTLAELKLGATQSAATEEKIRKEYKNYVKATVSYGVEEPMMQTAVDGFIEAVASVNRVRADAIKLKLEGLKTKELIQRIVGVREEIFGY